MRYDFVGVRRMSNAEPLRALTDGRFAFFREFLRHPHQIGSIIPSSRFLERRIVETAGINSAKTIVELGPGVGGTTRAILNVMGEGAKLVSVEINAHFHSLVSRIKDDRFIPHLGNALILKEITSIYGLSPPEVVISGIPFSTTSPATGTKIIGEITSVLSPGGRFVAYQLSKRVSFLSLPFLGPGHVEVNFSTYRRCEFTVERRATSNPLLRVQRRDIVGSSVVQAKGYHAKRRLFGKRLEK